jgi:hypothetical protein
MKSFQVRVLSSTIRAVLQGPFRYVAPGAWHSFRRADARPLIPGEAAEVKINLAPVSYLQSLLAS